MADNSLLVAAYWQYYALLPEYTPNPTREQRLQAIEQRKQVDMQPWEDVNDRVNAKGPGLVQLLVDLAEAAPDARALAYLGAGPLENLVNGGIDGELLNELKAAIKKNPKLFEAAKNIWVSADGQSPPLEDILYG